MTDIQRKLSGVMDIQRKLGGVTDIGENWVVCRDLRYCMSVVGHYEVVIW